MPKERSLSPSPRLPSSGARSPPVSPMGRGRVKGLAQRERSLSPKSRLPSGGARSPPASPKPALSAEEEAKRKEAAKKAQERIAAAKKKANTPPSSPVKLPQERSRSRSPNRSPKSKAETAESPKKSGGLLAAVAAPPLTDDKKELIQEFDDWIEDSSGRNDPNKKKSNIPKAAASAPNRLAKWKEQQKKRQPPKAADGKEDVVERVPKLSALLAMGGAEAEEQKKSMEQQKMVKWNQHKGTKWITTKSSWDGSSVSEFLKETVVEDVSMEQAMAMFVNDPEKYMAMYFSTKEKEYTFVLRKGTSGWKPTGLRKDDKGTYWLCQHKYKRLEPFEGNTLPKEFRDKYTDSMTFFGKQLHGEKNMPLMPGRGMGLGDEANMELVGTFPKPDDVRQGGSVSDCWLLSAIASLADFDWAVERLFRKSPTSIYQSPLDNNQDKGGNQYVVTLWDVKTWQQKDYHIDERLPSRPGGMGYLLGAKPSNEGKFWVPYLEKAVAAHCGGYEKLNGGQCTDAWAMLTGCRNQFIINKHPDIGKYWCAAKYNNKTNEWVDVNNSPQDSPLNIYQVNWPRVGGGGKDFLDEDQLFERIVTWDENNYLLGAGTGGSSDKECTNGVVDNHAYSIIDSRRNICGTGIDLLLLRNPWGEGGELENGQFMRTGPGWKKYPEIKKELNPSMDDNGLCWVTKKEFFQYFPTLYVCALNMVRLQDPNYINDLENHW